MRVLQLIDSLQPGGAERVAVNIANALSDKIEASFLCSTREEGTLKTSLNSKVGYLFLKKKNALDISAITKLNRYIKTNQINVIHAHSTSFFTATLTKFLNPKIILIWHDHYGNSEFLNSRKHKVLRICSKHFQHIISVNSTLKLWAEKRLKTKNITYLPNFAVINNEAPHTILEGTQGKRILHLANLRPQKDHETLFKAFKKMVIHYPDYTLHCVGKDFNDDYSVKIKNTLRRLDLEDQVKIYGSKKDIAYIISQCDIGVLSSKSEGLPIALLELGLSELPAVVTSVGDCKKVVVDHENGLVVPSKNPSKLAEAMMYLIENEGQAKQFGLNLKKRIEKEFSREAYIEELIKIYYSN